MLSRHMEIVVVKEGKNISYGTGVKKQKPVTAL